MDAIRMIQHRLVRSAAWSLAACLVVTSGVGCGWMASSQNVTGVGLFEQGSYPAALQEFQMAIQTDPENADSYYNVAATYHRTGKLSHNPSDLQQAETYYHLCLDRNPDHHDCYRGLAVLLVEEGRGTDAFSLLQRWTEHSPSSPEPRIELARLFEEFGDKKSAESHLQEAIALQPNNYRALTALGHIKEQSGDSGQALAVYQRSLAANQNQPQVEARVASLQGSAPGGLIVTPPDGTRTVAAPGGPLR